ncbi:MAG: four helix bundle protein [Prevotella sp.]|jgi:four helix bundle protein|nr:four helix bundle protein [Prevotella sp.]
MANSFKDIIAWQKAYDYCLLVYKSTENFPDFERFGLRSQFTRAAVSITANIAEGYKKISKQDKLRFFNIAQGSLEECRNYNLLARDLGYIDIDTFNELEAKANKAGTFISAYSNGVLNNNGIKD